MMLLASLLTAFAAIAALAVLDKRQRQKRHLADAQYHTAPSVRLGLGLLTLAGVIPFLEPSYTGWMSVIAFTGTTTIAGLAYAMIAAFNMRFAVRLAKAGPPLAIAIVTAELISR